MRQGRPSPLALPARPLPLLLDGGLATALEAVGQVLPSGLWSAGCLVSAPSAITRVHRSFLEAGADIIATAGYQASFGGFAREGFSDEEAAGFIRLAVHLAVAERDAFWAERVPTAGSPPTPAAPPLVAASVGPYGAFLADGSEYDGRYGLSVEELARFHRRRFRLLAESPADLIAFETIPSLPEAEALCRLLRETAGTWAWISFSCQDGGRISDGTPIEEAVELCMRSERLAAVGVNCTHPTFVTELVGRMRSATDLPIFAYPNSGETWDARSKRWKEEGISALAEFVPAWVKAGATGVGGCCRVGVREVRAMGRILARHRT